MPMLRYMKETQSQTGMRKTYNDSRARMLQRLYPQQTRVIIKTRSNGRGAARVFHQMPAGAIRNPLIIRKPELYAKVQDEMVAMTRRWRAAENAGNREKAVKRLARMEERNAS